MTEPQIPALFDKRFAKGMVKGIVHDYIKSNAKYLLAFSPQKLADELQIDELSIQSVWLVGGSVEVEDRKVEQLYTVTTEQQARKPQEENLDLFNYSVVSDQARSVYREILPSREAVIACFRCSGQGDLVENCEYCQGWSHFVCEICNGEKYREIICDECNGTGVEPNHTNPSIYPCKKCKGVHGLNGFIREPCLACNETGYSKTPCPNCENGKTRWACPECQGVGLLLQKEVLSVRNQTLRIETQPLEPEKELLSSLLETMEDIYITPPLLLKELRTHSNPLSPQVWERVTTKLMQECTDVLQKNTAEGFESQVKSIQASVYRGEIVYARFKYKERNGAIRVAFSGQGEPINYSIKFFEVRFSDFATELLVLLLSLAVGAWLSWYSGSGFPLLSIPFTGASFIVALRYLEWRDEFTSLLVRGFFALIIFYGIVGILTIFVQGVTGGSLDAQSFLILATFAIMTTLAIAGIQSEQATKFFGEFIKVILNKQ